MSKASADLAMVLLQDVDCSQLWEANYSALMSEGKLDGTAYDIDKIVRRTLGDYQEYNEDAMKEALFRLVWPSVKATLVTGCASWYRDKIENVVSYPEHDLGEAGA